MHVKARSGKQPGTMPRKPAKHVSLTKSQLTIRDLGWTRERAREVRAKLAAFAVDWDDASMDVYNEP